MGTPHGTVKVWEAVILTITSSLVFVYAAYQLNFVCFVLPPSPSRLSSLFPDQAFYLGVPFVSWACAFARSYGRVASSFGSPIDLQELATPFYLGLAVLFWLATSTSFTRCRTVNSTKRGAVFHSGSFWRCIRFAAFQFLPRLYSSFFRGGRAFCSVGSHLLVRLGDRCHHFYSGSTVWLLPPIFRGSIRPSLT